MIRLIDSYLTKPVNYQKYAKKIAKIDAQINARSSEGAEFLAWENIDSFINKSVIEKIEKEAEFIRKNYQILVVCGVGGSYLGARAAIKAINGHKKENTPNILFVGHTFSTDYVHDIIQTVKGKKFAINVISKSGSTTETAIAFRLLKQLMIEEHGEEYAKQSIVVTTDPEKGLLREIVKKEGYFSFDLPSNIGGRYSVLTPVGLFPMACAGINIKEVIKGAKIAEKACKNPNILENEAYKYAAIRYDQYRHGKSVEMLITYEPRLVQCGEWYKQLFAESEGKGKKGLLPYSLVFSTDLHSIGQFIQEGSQIFFETIVHSKVSNNEVIIPNIKNDEDNLNYLSGKSLDFVAQKTFEGVLKAHTEGANVPAVVIEVDKFEPSSIGALFYFFEKAAAMSAYLLGVNPFNQPGVEVYKKNMFELLGKKNK